MKNIFENKKIIFILFVLIAVEIFVFSSIPGSSMSNIKNIWPSRIYHMVVFFLFNFLLFILIKKEKIDTKQVIIPIIISLIYAALDEIHQMFVPFRGAGITDWLTDSLGIFASAIVYFYYFRKSKSNI
ncbi:VanZ family protein [Candidatus Pacearchaeota archaeon]|nr:VanZ family protein [Candidatus Pacearchaeota archaeon]